MTKRLKLILKLEPLGMMTNEVHPYISFKASYYVSHDSYVGICRFNSFKGSCLAFYNVASASTSNMVAIFVPSLLMEST